MSEDLKLKERAESLLAKLRRGSQVTSSPKKDSTSTTLHIISEFIGAFIVGLLCGLSIDILADVAPWGVGIGCLLGVIAGFIGVVRFIRRPQD